MKSQSTYDSLPSHLKTYVANQNYKNYTPREHASWRFIMRHARQIFGEKAHRAYLDGLKKTGLTISQIPNIENIDRALQKFGWGAVCVEGYIPPLIFLDFQARRILPIAGNMRSLEHLDYTPAPDIVHEAAGHAPILADPGYAHYLTQYAKLARKAIFSNQDIALYEAVRRLSDFKENPDCTAEDIARAEAGLKEAEAAVSWTSEASLVARMFWWTVEYGLIGDPKNPKIFGAGLLSSLGEGKVCLDKAVKKLPLSIDCIKQSFDITKPQPQLYIAASFEQLSQLLLDLEEEMAFKKGGAYGLTLAKMAQTVNSIELDSGLAISGVVSDFSENADGIIFVRLQGPCQLAYHGKELKGQGRLRHPHGFSSPLGLLLDGKDLSKDFAKLGLTLGTKATLDFASGFKLTGTLQDLLKAEDSRLLGLTWQDCEVKDPSGKIVFEKAWGAFDQVFGNKVVSVYSGPADWESYGEYDFGRADSAPQRTSAYTAAEKQLFSLYQEIRKIREQNNPKGLDEQSQEKLRSLAEILTRSFPKEWLIALEIIEIFAQNKIESPTWLFQLKARFLAQDKDPGVLANFKKGLEIAHILD